MPFTPEQISFATEDHTFLVPATIWKVLRKKLKSYVDEDLLVSASKKVDTNGNVAGPGAETGPIVSAVGVLRFFNLLREAVLESGQPSANLYQNVTMTVTGLTDSHLAKPVILEAEAYNPLIIDDLRQVISWPKNTIILPLNAFYSPLDNPNTSVARIFSEYLTCHSERSGLLKKLADYLFGPINFSGASFASTNRKQQGNPLSKWRVERPTVTNIDSNEHATAIKSRYGKWLYKADAIVFEPFDSSKPELVRANALRFFSAIVQKQLEAGSMEVPIIVKNDGSWTGILDIYFSFANGGMCKDYIRNPLLDNGQPPVAKKNCNHVATGMLDILNGSDIQALKQAERILLLRRRKSYVRSLFHGYERQDPVCDGSPCPKHLSTSAIYISSQSDNLALNQDAKKFTAFLARQGEGLVWGAGDRHAMRSVMQGYKQAGGRWLAGFSTASIIEQETDHGAVPTACDYSELHSDIFGRMQGMNKNSDIQYIFGGGPGTLQEALVALTTAKPVVFYSQNFYSKSQYEGDPFWDAALKTLLGNEDYEKLIRDPDEQKRQGIYIVHDYADLEALHMQLRSAPQRNLRAQPNTSRQPEI